MSDIASDPHSLKPRELPLPSDDLTTLIEKVNKAYREADVAFSVLKDDVRKLKIALYRGTEFTGDTVAQHVARPNPHPQYALLTDVDAVIGSLGNMSLQNSSAVSITGGSVTGITDLAVADGGTGRSTIGSDAILYGTGATTFATTTLTAFMRGLIDDIDASAGRSTLGLGTIATQASSAVSITGGSVTGITDLAVADGGTGSSTAILAARALDFLRSAFGGTYTTITATGSHSFSSSSSVFMAILVGAGGAGGAGSAGTGSGSFAGGGGGAGAVVVVFGETPGSSLSITIGAGSAGANGGTTSLSGSSNTGFTALGGEAASSGTPGRGGTMDSAFRSTSYMGFTVSIPMNGQDGHSGRVERVNYDGSGNVTSITHRAGIGGGGWVFDRSFYDYGAGATGSAAGTTSSTAGSNGVVMIWEA